MMNKPETQDKIRPSLRGYIRSFLDTAPEGRTQDRFLQVLLLLRHYFQIELEESRTEYTDLVLAALNIARKYIPTEEKLRAFDAIYSDSDWKDYTAEELREIKRKWDDEREEYERELWKGV